MIAKKDIIENQLVKLDYGEEYPDVYGIIENVKKSGRTQVDDKDELQFDVLLFISSNVIDGICEHSDYSKEYLSVVDKKEIINDFKTRYKLEGALLQTKLKETIL